MGSGLILLLIVGAWLAVLVPVALRSHEASSALATVDKFHDAMRVLSRRDGVARRKQGDGVARRKQGDGVARRRQGDGVARGGDGSTVTRDGDGAATVIGTGAAHGTSVPAPAAAPPDAAASRRSRRPGPTPASRRLRVLVVLVVVAVATLVGAVVVSWWLLVPHLVADLLLVGFLCWLRSRAVAKEEQEWRRAMGERRPDPAPASSAVRVTSARPAVTAVVPAARIAGIPDRLPSRALLDRAAERLAAVPAQSAPGRSAQAPEQERVRGAQGQPWQPVPVPAPMYVSAPTAPRRVLDLTRTPARAPLSSAERSVGIDDHGPELDHILDRRAVGD